MARACFLAIDADRIEVHSGPTMMLRPRSGLPCCGPSECHWWAPHVDLPLLTTARERGSLRPAHSAQGCHSTYLRSATASRLHLTFANEIVDPAESTGGGNTLFLLQRWSASDEASHADVLHRRAEVGDVGPVAARCFSFTLIRRHANKDPFKHSVQRNATSMRARPFGLC